MITDKTILGSKLSKQIKLKLGNKIKMHPDSVQASKAVLNDYFLDFSLSIEFLTHKHKISKATFYKYCKIYNIDFRQEALKQLTINDIE